MFIGMFIGINGFWFFASLVLTIALLGMVGYTIATRYLKAREERLMRTEIRDWEIPGDTETMHFEGVLLARNEMNIKGLWREFSLYRMSDGRHLLAWEIASTKRHETAGYRVIEHGENIVERLGTTLKSSDQTSDLVRQYRERLQEPRSETVAGVNLLTA